MADISKMTDEERFEFGSWLYYVQQGWVDPNWWDDRMDLAEATGHVLTVNFTTP